MVDRNLSFFTGIDRRTMAVTTRSGRQSAPCPHCDRNPCEAVQYGRMFVGVTNDVHEDEPNNAKRKAAYRYYVQFKHGRLGQGNRVVIPDCIKDLIRSQYPDPNGEYMGHKDF
jgi:hypothetical protein